MSDYLPLCAFRQGLLPAACRSCAWWQTTTNELLSPESATDKRRRWMAALEGAWGTTGLLLEGDVPAVATPPGDGSAAGTRFGGAQSAGAGAPVIVASISFAPADSVPRLRGLPFSSLPSGSALLFCLKLEEGQARSQAKRVLNKALGQLKTRGVSEAYALAGPSGETGDGNVESGCRGFFSADFLLTNGFEQITENGGLGLMRVDLRGLLALVGQVETAVRRMLRNEPTPSPAAWTRRETS